MDLAPLDITNILFLLSSVKSADISLLYSDPKWTPPIPPVAKNFIPILEAIFIVVATVVAALCLWKRDITILCKDTFSTFLDVAKSSISFSFNPIMISPFIIPIVAATLPLSSTALIDSLATFIFSDMVAHD